MTDQAEGLRRAMKANAIEHKIYLIIREGAFSRTGTVHMHSVTSFHPTLDHAKEALAKITYPDGEAIYEATLTMGEKIQ